MQPDLNTPIETMGEALATNNKLEVLIMRENKIKWVHYCNFWNLILTNTTLLKMNLQKTDLSDRVVEKMGKYLEQPNVSLVDLDISKNQITDAGLKTLCASLKINQTIKFLNLSGNKIKDDGLNDLVDVLNDNKTL
jgi:Ran GTPase-activating protein (RanGAP) involved in mRNA processing and transport